MTVRIRHGWSGEYASNKWGKYDVTVDDEDLWRLLTENGLDEIHEEALRLTTVETFILLDAEAQRFLLAGMIAKYGYPAEAGTEEMNRLTGRRDAVIASIKARVAR